jgi:hypothetical protein
MDINEELAIRKELSKLFSRQVEIMLTLEQYPHDLQPAQSFIIFVKGPSGFKFPEG